MNLSLLQLSGVIFHLIPERPTDPKQAAGPSLSDKEQELPPVLAHYIRDQIVGTFNRSRQNAEPDPDRSSEIPATVMEHLTETRGHEVMTEQFIRMSQIAAQRLYESQRANAPEGLLVVARGAVGGVPVICFAKLERQSGLSFDVRSDGGSQIVMVNMEDGLVLTDDTSVFKACVMWVRGTRSPSIAAIVSDEQSGKVYSAPITDYWLRSFLGCTYSNSADVQTRAFIKGIGVLVNTDIEDLDERARIQEALSVELRSNNAAIDPVEFVRTHVPLDAQDRAVTRLREAGAPPSAFPKGLDVVNHMPRNTWYEFSDGTRLKVPIDHQVKITRVTTLDGDILTVRGEIDRIR